MTFRASCLSGYTIVELITVMYQWLLIHSIPKNIRAYRGNMHNLTDVESTKLILSLLSLYGKKIVLQSNWNDDLYFNTLNKNS